MRVAFGRAMRFNDLKLLTGCPLNRFSNGTDVKMANSFRALPAMANTA